MDSARVVTRSRLATDLTSLGIRRGDVVMMHESVRAVGWIVGGPDVLLDAVFDALGPDGTLMKYVGSEDGTYALAEWPPEVQQAYRDECPAYDPSKTRACREWGILCEYLRTRPGAERSAHPDGSFVALGPRAKWLVEAHPLRYGFGPGSPVQRLVEAGGKVLLAGAPPETTTLLHHFEHVAKVENKRIVRFRSPVLQDGKRVWVDIEEFDTSNGIVPQKPGEDDHFEQIVRGFLASGKGRTGLVGHATSHLLDARELHDFGVAWMERNLSPAAARA